MKRIPFACLAVVAALVFCCTARSADDNNGAGGRGGRGRGGPNNGQNTPNNGGNNGGNNNGGNTFGGRGFGNFGNLGNLGTTAGVRDITSTISRMLGFEVPDPKAAPKLDQLPLGPRKRLVMEVPVGGVDNFNGTGAGWKMEAVFKLTPEQVKAADSVREEYTAEEKKLNQEIVEAQKALAAKVLELRQKYEKKANDILTGADKETKEKMDALAAEVYEKNATIVNETVPLYDTKDLQQGLTMIRALREKTSKTVQDGQDKLLQLIPEDSRPKFQEIMKTQADQRQRTDRLLQGGARGIGGGRGGDDPVKPPKAPEGDKF